MTGALFFLLSSMTGITKSIAQDFTVGVLNYSVNDDGVSVTVTGHVDGQDATGSLVIPDLVSYEGVDYPVTTIEGWAFAYCTGFTGGLTIPNSVTIIVEGAFYGCYGFTGSLTIPNFATSIGDYAFSDCYGFTGTLTIPSSVTSIGGYAFYNCSGITEVVYNATNCADINYDWSSPFTGCGSSLVIGENVERIPAYMFQDCSVFTGSLTIPNSVTIIGDWAFSSCYGFTGSLTIPNSVTTIGNGAFSGCFGFTGCLTIPNSVITIGDYAFSDCQVTGSLTIPNSVTTIGDEAFSDCYGFTGSLIIPSSVTLIGNSAFNRCSGFSEVVFNAANCADVNGSSPFSGCRGSLVIGENVERIPAYMFSECSSFIGGLNIPNSVTTIGNGAFSGCYGFTDALTIPSSVKTIGNEAFSGCYGFTDALTIPSSVKTIGNKAFYECSGFTEVVFNAANCADVSDDYSSSPFSGCGGSLVIGENVERIPAYMFNECSGFTGSLTILNSVTIIGDGAFNGCFGFTGSLIIPSSVTTIGYKAFHECSGFSEVVFNATNCADVSDDYSSSPFSGCGGSLFIGENVERIPAYIFRGCSGFTGSLTIPNSVTTIGGGAFSQCSGFTGSLTIPNSVTTIGGGAFSQCSGFTGSLTIPSSITSIGGSAFFNCSGFTEVVYDAANCADVGYYSSSPFLGCGSVLVIGDNVERIPAYMFYKCSNYTGSLTIPNSVTSIGGSAFSNCSGFTEVVYNAANCADMNDYSSPFLYCGNSLVIGENVENIPAKMFKYCNNFTGSLTIPNSVTSIGGSAFYYCSGFTGSLTIPNSVTTIAEDVFGGCSGFTGSLTIPNSITTIAEAVFSGCSGFTGSLIIPNSVTSIGNSAFSYCSGFTAINSFAETPPVTDRFAFSGMNYDILVTVPCGTISAYQSASGWNQFTNYQQECPDATISDDICFGEDYLQNGFEIIQPEVGEQDYYLTLPSSQGADSLVHLVLTVNPVYYLEEDTIVCGSNPFAWHGHTYSESGIYYDTLQTIHGCDSIIELSLELFNTPLGEFTYMSPTNNYPFTSLPITFSWDAVTGAEYYDLYVWDADGQMPDEPFAANLWHCSYSTRSLQNYHSYNWFVTARNACYETSSSVKSFYLDITPSLNVNVEHIDFGEVAMNQSVSTTLNVTGVVLEDMLNVQITGEDAEMFSFVKASGWDDYNGGVLIISFNPTTPQYSYHANLVVSSGSFTKTTVLTGAVSNLYVFNTFVDEDIYAMNSEIPIHGTLADWNNAPVADAEVEISVFVMGMKRTLQAVTDANGQFSAVFKPMPSESGYYTINSDRPGSNSTAVHLKWTDATTL